MVRKRRQRRKGEEPKAGHCHWSFGSSKEGRQGSAKGIKLTTAADRAQSKGTGNDGFRGGRGEAPRGNVRRVQEAIRSTDGLSIGAGILETAFGWKRGSKGRPKIASTLLHCVGQFFCVQKTSVTQLVKSLEYLVRGKSAYIDHMPLIGSDCFELRMQFPHDLLVKALIALLGPA